MTPPNAAPVNARPPGPLQEPLLPLITYVYLSWAFDESDRLIDVIVTKKQMDRKLPQ